MDSTRKTAVVAGVVFIIATVSSLLGASLVPVLTGTDYLIRVSANANQVAAGAFFLVIAAFMSAGIAIALYPVLKKTSEGLALGSVVFRAIEAVMYTAGVVSLLSLRTLGQQVTVQGVMSGESAER